MSVQTTARVPTVSSGSPATVPPIAAVSAATPAVFVDLTGRHSRAVTLVGVVVAALMLVFVIAAVSSVLVSDPVPHGALPPTTASAPPVAGGPAGG